MEKLAELRALIARHGADGLTRTPLDGVSVMAAYEPTLPLGSISDDVAGAGYAVGYNSPSQFSREYARRYGRPPGKDAERLRAS